MLNFGNTDNMGLSGINIKIVIEHEFKNGKCKFDMYDKEVNNAEDFIPMLSTEEYPRSGADRYWMNFLPFKQAPAHNMLYKGAYDYPDFKMMVRAFHTYTNGKLLFASELDNWLVLESTLRNNFIKLEDKYNWWQDVHRYKIINGDVIHWVWYFEYFKNDLYFCYFQAFSNGYKNLFGRRDGYDYQPALSQYYRNKFIDAFDKSLAYDRGYWEGIASKD